MVRRLLMLIVLLCAAPAAFAEPPIVLAASSLQGALDEAADVWAAHGHQRPRIAYAGTPALARQIAAGAPADIFLSADSDWADTLDRQGLLRAGTRANILANRLVLVVPAGELRAIGRLRDLPRWLGARRLALAEPESVPAGRYARAALEAAGVWAVLEPQVVRTENVRGALLLVARGTASAGFVYATDARIEPGVRTAGRVPARLHPPIDYVVAIPRTSANAEAALLRAFLLSREALAIFVRHGFLPPHR